MTIPWKSGAVAAALALSACAPRDADRVVSMRTFDNGPVDAAAPCADDAREEDDEISHVLAKVSKEGEKFDAVSCPGDDDYVHVLADGRLAASVTWNASEGDLHVDMFDSNVQQLTFDQGMGFEERSEGRAHLQRAGTRGNYFLRIRNRAGTPVKYRVTLVPAPEPKRPR